MRAQAYLLAALLATVTTAGCAEYKYYDITVNFNTTPPMAFSSGADVFLLQNCVVTVSGADSAEKVFEDTEDCPPVSMTGQPLTTMGTFEYSSTADSGQLTFTFKGYVGRIVEACLVGEGATTVPVGPTTQMGTLVVNRINAMTTCE